MGQVASRVREVAQARFDEGAAPRLDVMQAELGLSRAKADLELARSARLSAQAELNALFNRPPTQALAVQGDAAEGALPSSSRSWPAPRPATPSFARPSDAVAIEERRLGLLKAERIPTPIVSLGAVFDAPGEFDVGYRAGLSLAVPLFDRNQGQIAGSLALGEQARLRRDALRRSVEAKAFAAHARAVAQRALVAAYRDTLVPTATTIESLAEEGYRLGRSPVLAVLDAQRTLRDQKASTWSRCCPINPRSPTWRMCSVDRSSRAATVPALLAAAFAAVLASASASARRATRRSNRPRCRPSRPRSARSTKRDLVESLLVRGSVAAPPNEDVRLAAQVPGRVVAMRVAEGDSVRAGEVVAEIETPPLEDQQRQARAAHSQARVGLENAKLNLARTERLFERGIAAGKEVEDARSQAAAAEAALEQAQAALATADRQLARAHVTSPISGQVVKRFVGVGEQVDGTPGQPLLEIANVERVEMAAHVSADRLGRVLVGQRAELVSDAWPDRRFEGVVLAISPAIDPATNAALVRLRVVNSERALKVGMFAQARIGLAEKKGVLVVPPSALNRSEAGTAVYVVSGQDATRTPGRGRPRDARGGRAGLRREGGPEGPHLGGARPRGAGEARRQTVNVARFAARNSRVILLGIVLLSAAGLYAALTLPSNIYPEVEFPRIQMVARAGDLSPGMMQLAVTRPLEEAARTVLGVRRVRSKTIRGGCEISVIFNPDANMPYSLQLMQAKADEVRPELPAGTALVVERMTPSLFPILSINVTGALPAADLRDLAVYQLRPLLSRVPGVADVEVLASEEREISVIVDPDRLNAAKLTLEQVSDALKATNQVVSAGRLPKDYRQYLVLASGELRSVEDVRQVVVAFRQGTPLYLGDLAEVREGVIDRTTLISGNGRPAALLNVARQIRGNILEVADGVWSALKEYRPSLPPSLKLQVVYDLAEFVRAAVASVRDAILIGALLSVLVLVAFLRDLRVTAIAAVTLPLTLVGTFFVLLLAGGTLNLMSLGGLAIAIGLVIDDAIVIVENIHRHRAAGAPVAVAAEKGTQELVAAVVGSTLTTVVVFVPLGLLQGVVGQFFSALSLTLAAAVLLSLGYSLLFIPTAAARFLEDREPRAAGLGWLGERYRALLGASLRRPKRVVLVTLGLAALAAVLYSRLETGFLPEMDEGGYVIDYWTPEGTSLAETDRMVRRIEEVVAATPEVAGFARRTGAELGLFATEQNRGDIVVKLKPAAARKRRAEDVIEEQRATFAAQMPGMTIEFVKLLKDMLGDLEGVPEDIEVKIFGDDLGELAPAGRPHRRAAQEDPGPRRPGGAPARQPRGRRARRPHARGARRPERRGRGQAAVGGPAGPGGDLVPTRRPPDRRARALPRRAALRPRLDPRVPADDSGRRDRAAVRDRDDRAGAGRDAALPRGPQADGAGHGPARGPRPGQRRARRAGGARGRRLAGRLLVRHRRAAREPAGLVPLDAARAGDRLAAGARGAGGAVPALHAGARDPVGGAPVARRSLRPAAAHRHAAQRLLLHGPDPADRAGGQERHHPGGLRRHRGGARREPGRGARRGRNGAAAADPDDDALHALRPAAARARARLRRRAAEAARDRRDRRPHGLDDRDARVRADALGRAQRGAGAKAVPRGSQSLTSGCMV